jgi:hypothetical protein
VFGGGRLPAGRYLGPPGRRRISATIRPGRSPRGEARRGFAGESGLLARAPALQRVNVGERRVPVQHAPARVGGARTCAVWQDRRVRRQWPVVGDAGDAGRLDGAGPQEGLAEALLEGRARGGLARVAEPVVPQPFVRGFGPKSRFSVVRSEARARTGSRLRNGRVAQGESMRKRGAIPNRTTLL